MRASHVVPLLFLASSGASAPCQWHGSGVRRPLPADETLSAPPSAAAPAVKGLEAVRSSSKVFLEAYTSELGVDKAKLVRLATPFAPPAAAAKRWPAPAPRTCRCLGASSATRHRTTHTEPAPTGRGRRGCVSRPHHHPLRARRKHSTDARSPSQTARWSSPAYVVPPHATAITIATHTEARMKRTARQHVRSCAGVWPLFAELNCLVCPVLLAQAEEIMEGAREYTKSPAPQPHRSKDARGVTSDGS